MSAIIGTSRPRISREIGGHRAARSGRLYDIHSQVGPLRQIDTWTAADNTHMIAINDQIGFRPIDRWVRWQLRL